MDWIAVYDATTDVVIDGSAQALVGILGSDAIGLDASAAVLASAKEGIGTEEILEGIVEHFPPPNAPAGLLTRIRIDKVGGYGPWAS